MSAKCFVCKDRIFDEDGQCYGEEIGDKWFCNEHIPIEFSNFEGQRYYPERETAYKDCPIIVETFNRIEILVRLDDESHPLLITLNKSKKTFDTELYD